MNLAILHYHFNRGGVTQVVLNQLRALDAVLPEGSGLRVALMFGGRREGVTDQQLAGFKSLELAVHTIEALDYDDGMQPDHEALATEIDRALRQLNFAPDQSLLHIHNHALGKNLSLLGAIRRLAGEGYRLLLQIHDFAEDLRPDNYSRLSNALANGADPSAALYPQASQIHYAALNGRDFQVLRKTGVAEDNLHLLPNAVGEFGEMPDREVTRVKLNERFGVAADRQYVVYPVRGIRRKNLGEMLLWSALCGETSDATFAVTLPPLNPIEASSYGYWRRLAQELELPCVFDVGAPGGLEFKENLTAADLLLTTSIAEGFGMVFLECWLAGRGLIGRNLPEITSDFEQAGICFDRLYSALLVPIEWAGRDDVHDSLLTHYRRLLQEYGADAVPRADVDRQIGRLLDADEIDFARLDAALQTRIIRHASGNAQASDELLAANPQVQAVWQQPLTSPLIDENAEVVRQSYSLTACGERLWQLYKMILAGGVSRIESLPRAERILETFLDVRRMYPVRFER